MNIQSPTHLLPPELSRVLSLDKLTRLEKPYKINATAAERAALCERMDVASIERLEIEYTAKWRGSFAIDYDVKGILKATLHQRCVATLAPVFEEIVDEFEFRVVHPNQEEFLQEELDSFEDIEFSKDGDVDLGEIATQYLILALNPYPRAALESEVKKDAAIPTYASTGKPNPFAVLKVLKKDT